MANVVEKSLNRTLRFKLSKPATIDDFITNSIYSGEGTECCYLIERVDQYIKYLRSSGIKMSISKSLSTKGSTKCTVTFEGNVDRIESRITANDYARISRLDPHTPVHVRTESIMVGGFNINIITVDPRLAFAPAFAELKLKSKSSDREFVWPLKSSTIVEDLTNSESGGFWDPSYLLKYWKEQYN